MNLNRIFKTVFLTEFYFSFIKAIKEIFKPKKTINYPFEKGTLAQDIEVSMRLEDILTVKKDV